MRARGVARAWIAAAAMLACAIARAARARAVGQHAPVARIHWPRTPRRIRCRTTTRRRSRTCSTPSRRFATPAPTTIAAGDSVLGNVAVLWGPLTIAGTVHGSVIVVNGPVTIEPGGHVDKDVIVTGGTVTGADSTTVGGRGAGAQRCAALPAGGRAHHRRVARGRGDSGRELVQALARRHVRQRHGFTLVGGPYNRVEGCRSSAGRRFARTSASACFASPRSASIARPTISRGRARTSAGTRAAS